MAFDLFRPVNHGGFQRRKDLHCPFIKPAVAGWIGACFITTTVDNYLSLRCLHVSSVSKAQRYKPHVFLVAELKAKAAGVTSAGVEKMQNVRDRNTRYAVSDHGRKGY